MHDSEEAKQIGLATARLVAAAATGDEAGLRALLAEQPQLARQTVSACGVLADLEGLQRWAAQNVEFVLSKGGVADTPALGYVCLGRLGGDEAARVACADFLLGHGADPNATWLEDEFEGRLPILYAATGRNNYPKLAQRLLAAGARPNDGESIYHAAEANHTGCLEALLAAGADLSVRDPHWQNTPLYFVLGWSPQSAPATKARAGIVWLLEHGADPNVTVYDQGETPLFAAIRNGWDLELIELLLRHGADADVRRSDGRSALAEAVRGGREDVATLLRERGAKSEVTAADRFLCAVTTGKAPEAAALLAAQPEWRETLADEVAKVLFEAAKRGQLPVIETAVALGFAFDRPLACEEGPLHGAALQGRVDVVRRLIELGADLHRRDRTFHAPPLGWCVWGSTNVRAKGADYGAVADLLLAAGAARPPEDGQHGSAEVRAAFARQGGAGIPARTDVCCEKR